MATAQSGIFKGGSNHFTFLEFKLNTTFSAQEIRNALQVLAKPLKVTEILAFGKSAWDILSDSSPQHFTNYDDLKGVNGYTMPSTQNDVFFWIHSADESDNFDRAKQLTSAFTKIGKCVVNQTAFIYHDKRDFMGFVDGTGNPNTDDLRYQAAIIPEGEIGEGGSIVFSQRWEHNLPKFENVPVKEQEGIIGRTKVEDVELEGEDMQHNSHVSRTDLKVDGEAMKVWRRSAPYVHSNKNGLFFLCFACNTQRIQIQLESMLGLTEDKVHDRIMEFSTPVTGSYWFAPSEEELKKVMKN